MDERVSKPLLEIKQQQQANKKINGFKEATQVMSNKDSAGSTNIEQIQEAQIKSKQPSSSNDAFSPKSPFTNNSNHSFSQIKSSSTAFVKENTGNIKDFYKISSCIGRGKYIQYTQLIIYI